MGSNPSREPSKLGPPASKAEYVLERLRDEIEGGLLRPGDALRQSELAQRYGVSPTPVREALRLLESEGTVVYSPHRGAIVTRHDEQRMQDLYALRARMESLAAELCAVRRSEEELAEIIGLQDRLRAEADDPDITHVELASSNRDLHLTIAAVGSPAIAGQLTPLWGIFPTHRTMWKKPGLVHCFLGEHDAILEAIERRDGAAAGAAMHRHILSALNERRADPTGYIWT